MVELDKDRNMQEVAGETVKQGSTALAGGMGKSDAVLEAAPGMLSVPGAAAGKGSCSICGRNNDRAIGQWRILHKDQ